MDERFVLLGGKDGDSFHRSVLGRFATEVEAEAKALLLTDLGEIDWWLVSDRKTGRTLEPAAPSGEAPADPRLTDTREPDPYETVPVLHFRTPESSSTTPSWS